MPETYKGYSKKATSDKMMRIIKRERILSIIVSGYYSDSATLERVNPTPEGILRSEMSWRDANLTRLTIMHSKDEKHIFDWKVKLIEETGWLYNPKFYETEMLLCVEWEDTKKLRIYYDWLHYAKLFTVRKILKYMYSPLFISMFFIDQRDKNVMKDKNFMISLPYEEDVESLKKWANDIFGYNFESEHLTFDFYQIEFNRRNFCHFIQSAKEYLAVAYPDLYPTEGIQNE